MSDGPVQMFQGGARADTLIDHLENDFVISQNKLNSFLSVILQSWFYLMVLLRLTFLPSRTGDTRGQVVQSNCSSNKTPESVYIKPEDYFKPIQLRIKSSFIIKLRKSHRESELSIKVLLQA